MYLYVFFGGPCDGREVDFRGQSWDPVQFWGVVPSHLHAGYRAVQPGDVPDLYGVIPTATPPKDRSFYWSDFQAEFAEISPHVPVRYRAIAGP